MRRPASAPAAVLPLAALLVAGLFVTCRDAPELIDPPELDPLGPAPYRLTFDPDKDLAPTWSASGDSVLYVSQTELVFPDPPPPGNVLIVPGPGILKVIHREGGVASKVLPSLQPTDRSGGIDFAVQSVDERVAAYTLRPLLPMPLCPGGEFVVCDPAGEEGTPVLDGAILRVRMPGAPSPPESDPVHLVQYEGRTLDTTQHPGGLSGVFVVDRHPFQRRYNETGRLPSHVSWAPDGNRLVFSDGLRLLIWNPDAASVTPISGTADGINPAWSPTGGWIAFERLERGGLEEAVCEHRLEPIPPDTVPGPVVCIEHRRTWSIASSSLALIRPDGTGLRLLPEGSRPAWGPAGQRVYYEAGGMIWSVAIDGAGAAPVPDTQNGLDPAVSPDGKWLAFSRVDPLTGAADIWIVGLEP